MKDMMNWKWADLTSRGELDYGELCETPTIFEIYPFLLPLSSSQHLTHPFPVGSRELCPNIFVSQYKYTSLYIKTVIKDYNRAM